MRQPAGCDNYQAVMILSHQIGLFNRIGYHDSAFGNVLCVTRFDCLGLENDGRCKVRELQPGPCPKWIRFLFCGIIALGNDDRDPAANRSDQGQNVDLGQEGDDQIRALCSDELAKRQKPPGVGSDAAQQGSAARSDIKPDQFNVLVEFIRKRIMWRVKGYYR